MKCSPIRSIGLIFGILLLSYFQIEAQSATSTIVTAKGDNVFDNTVKVCNAIGLQNIVPGKRVGILVNSDFKVKGAYVNPDVTIAVVKQCFEAGATEVVFLQHVKAEYWERSQYFSQYAKTIGKTRSIEKNNFPSVFDPENFVKLDSIPRAKHLTNIEIVKEVFDVDVFINIPIAKHHASTILTGAMKNLMGLNTRAFNVTFHLNGPSRNDPSFLATCIAELNLVRKSDIIIADVTEVITTNGPGGPGTMVSPMTVVASNDVVAIDAFCSSLIGFEQERVLTVKYGYDLGLGQMDLSKVKIISLDSK
jgi:uncharacterized protein (DUF362 family)